MQRIIIAAAAFSLIGAVTLAGDSADAIQQPGPAGAQIPTAAGGQVRMTNATLRMMIRSAYRLTLIDEIDGGPAWLDVDGFDVAAKPAMPVTLLESSYMMRTLLADRFQLAVRKEAREKPIYALVLARRDGSLGSQMKRPAGECTPVDVLAVLRAELPTEN